MDAISLFRLIHACTSSESSQIPKAAMIELQACECQNGFLQALLDIMQLTESKVLLFDPNVAPCLKDIRLMAVISIKNLIRRCWNSNRGGDLSQSNSNYTSSSELVSKSPKFLSGDEKNVLKQFLSSDQVLDKDDKVARQLCSLVGTVAKVDWPQGWPQLMPNMLKNLQSLLAVIMPLVSKPSASEVSEAEEAYLVETEMNLYKYLCIIGETLEVLSKKRLPKAKNEFQRLSAECFGVISSPALHFLKTFTDLLQLTLAQTAHRSEDLNMATQYDSAVSAYSGNNKENGTLFYSERGQSQDQSHERIGDDHLGRSRILESCGMCAYKWAQILSILLESSFKEVCTHPSFQTTVDSNPAADDGASGGHYFAAFMERYLECMRCLADVVRDAQLFCIHTDSIAGRGWRSILRFDPLASTAENDELLLALCDDAATGAQAGLKAALQIARRILHLQSESLVDVQKEYPLHFSTFVGSCLQCFHTQLIAEYRHPLIEVGKVSISSCPAFVMHATLFLSNSLSCREYELSARGLAVDLPSDELRRRLEDRIHENGVPPVDASANLTLAVMDIQAFLSPENTALLLDLVLNHLMPLTVSDLTEWADEPEAYILLQQSNQEKSSIRSAAESLFLAILENDWVNVPSSRFSDGNVDAFQSNHAAILYMRQALSAAESHLRALVSDPQLNGPVQAQELIEKDMVLFWDSLFLCVGLGSASLTPALHHPSVVSWWLSSLAPILQGLLIQPALGSVGGCQVMRSRLVWLLRCWYYHFEAESHTQILELVHAMLDPAHGSDTVVLLETAKLAETSLEMLQIDVKTLTPMFNSLTSLFANLAAQLIEPELQSTVIDVLGKLVLSMGRDIEGLLVPFVTHFAKLWRGCCANNQGREFEDQSSIVAAISDQVNAPSQMTLRRSILATLTMSINAARDISPECVEALFPILIDSFKRDDVDLAFQIPEAVDLWRATMRAAFRNCEYSVGWEHLLHVGLHGVFGLHEDSNGNGAINGSRLDEGVDVLAHTCDVLQSYALFGRSACLEGCRIPIAGMYLKTIGTVAPRAVDSLICPLKTFLLVAPAQTVSFLLDSGLASALFKTCAASMSFPFVSEHLQRYLKPHKEDDLALVSYLTIIARVTLVDIHALRSIVGALHSELSAVSVSANSEMILSHVPDSLKSSPNGVSGFFNISPGPDFLVYGFVRLLIDRFDAVGHSSTGIYSRRLWCLSLLCMFMYDGSNSLVTDCPSIIPLYTEVLHVVKDLQSELGTLEGAEKLDNLPSALAGGAINPAANCIDDVDFDVFGIDDGEEKEGDCWIVSVEDDAREGNGGGSAKRGPEHGQLESPAVQAIRSLLRDDPIMTTSVQAAAELMEKTMAALTSN